VAKIKAYKLVNVGAIESSPFKTVRASVAPVKAINGIGTTLTGMGRVFNDLTSIAKGTLKAYDNIEQDKRRQIRRQRDAAAERRQEKATSKLKKSGKSKGKKALKRLGIFDIIMKKFKDAVLQIFAPVLGPLSGWFGMIVGVVAAKGVFDIFTDEEKKKKFVETFEKAKCVFGKIFGFVKDRIDNIWQGWKKLTGEEGNFIDRLTGLGELLAGIGGLLLAFNPIGMFGLIIDALFDGEDKTPKKKTDADADGKKKTQPDADGTKTKPGLDPDLDGLDIDPKTGKPKAAIPDPPPKRGGIFGFVQDKLDEAAKLKDRLMKSATDKFGLVGDWAKKQYASLSEGVRKQWENIVNVSKRLTEKSKAIASGIGNKVGDAKKFIAEGVESISSKAKQVVMDKILTPLGKLMEPIITKLKGMADKILGPLFETPIGKKILEALKKKGINGAGDFAGIAKRVGGKALPIIGGLVNMMFAYDRFANEDPYGGILEALSAGFDLSTLFGFVPGAGISMGIDAYMFARDLVPGVQQFEEELLKKIPGATALGEEMKKLGKKLPNLGQIIGMLGGKPPENLDEKASGGKVSLYAGHADMLPSDPSGAFGTAGGKIVNGNQSSGLRPSEGGTGRNMIPAAESGGYLSNEAYLNDKIAQKAAQKSGGIAIYRKPIRTRSGSDPQGNWKRGKADAARGMTSIEIHMDAPSPMGMAGMIATSPAIGARMAKNSILREVTNAYGKHRVQKGFGFVGSNYKQGLLEIAALNTKELKNSASFIESQSSKLANAIKKGAGGYDSSVTSVDEGDLGPGNTGADYGGGSLSADESAVSSASTPSPAMMNPVDAFTDFAKRLFGDKLGDDFSLAEKKADDSALKSGVDPKELFGKAGNLMSFSEAMKFDTEALGEEFIPVVINSPVAIPYSVPINTPMELTFGSVSSLLGK
tara:strand:+ start:1787 stop:4573 length:2787 start_codon:yes stop_codon:yes gene_type:complete